MVALVGASALYAGLSSIGSQGAGCSVSGGVVPVVAAENFWGSLVSQIGGIHTSVLSIVTDPNADPHEYEGSAANAQAIADACLVVVNGAGYDSWALSLISATGNQYQTILNVQQLLGEPSGTNPHFWYSPQYVNETVKAMYRDLVRIDPADGSYFTRQYASLNASIGAYSMRIDDIARRFGGTKVAATEDIFVYLANATKLDLVSPPEFMQAVAEGNDPSAAGVAAFQQQLENRSVALLVFNEQTITPLTDSVKALASQYGIPVVGVTETIQPPGTQFQAWMNSELIAIESALALGGSQK